MNKHPMLSVKEAAKLMGCDERWVRERLNQGQLKGEKKKVGLKDKWYVYAGEVEASLEKLKGVTSISSTDYLASPPRAPTETVENSANTDNDAIIVDGWTDEEDDTDNLDKVEGSLRWLQEQRQALAEIAEEMMRPLVVQLQEKDSQLESRDKALQAANYQLGYINGRMKDQEEQIKLLPDFQARAEKAELLEREAKAAKARAVELEESLIQTEQAKQLAMTASEEERKRTAALEAQLVVLEQEKQALEIRAEEAYQTAQKLVELEKVVLELQKPKPSFWQKLLGSQ